MLGLCYSKKILCNIVLLKKNLDKKCQHCEKVRHYFGVKICLVLPYNNTKRVY